MGIHPDFGNVFYMHLIIKKVITIFLALQVLNLSICNAGFYAMHITDSSNIDIQNINPIDSFAEMIIEQIEGYENAFPETNVPTDKPSADLKNNITFKMIQQDYFPKDLDKGVDFTDAFLSLLTGFQNNYSFLFYKEINHPPA